MYLSFTNTLASLSTYESANNFVDLSCDTSHVSHVTVTEATAERQSFSLRHLSADFAEVKLIQAQININEVMVDMDSNSE